jgi:hypothetical protein
VFVLEKGTQLPDDKIQGILNIAQKVIDKFHQKFDWSKNRQQQTSSDYVEKSQPTADQKFDSSGSTTQTQAGTTEKKEPEKKNVEAFNFEALDF